MMKLLRKNKRTKGNCKTVEWKEKMRKNIVALALAGLIIIVFSCETAWAAPPIYAPIGEERALNSNLYVVEGNLAEFTVSASDPDGDTLTYSAEDIPSWASFDPATRTFSGTAPLWSDDFETRKNQDGIFDVTFKVTDGTYTVSKIVTINVLDSQWTNQTMAQLVANRPITQGATGSPITLTNVKDETILTDSGKEIRRITFNCTTQVPDIPGWEDDWWSECMVYLPINAPAAYNVGAIHKNGESEGAQKQFGENSCAALDLPVLLVTQNGRDFNLMASEYFDKSIETRDPKYLWFVYSSAHLLRLSDALFTVMDTMTDWPVSYQDFKVIVAGGSKFGYTCWTTAAADPQRVIGINPGCFEPYDHDAYRLLAREQGATMTMSGAYPTYEGLILKYFTEPLGNLNEMSDVRGMLTGTTNDMRGWSGAYQSKYLITASERQLTIPRRVGYVRNKGHVNGSPWHGGYLDRNR